MLSSLPLPGFLSCNTLVSLASITDSSSHRKRGTLQHIPALLSLLPARWSAGCAKSLLLPLAFRWLRLRILPLPCPITSFEAVLGFPGWLRITLEAHLYPSADNEHISHRCCKNTPARLSLLPDGSVSTLEHFALIFPKGIPASLRLPTTKLHYSLYYEMFPGFLFRSVVLLQQHAMPPSSLSEGFLPLLSDAPVPDNTPFPGYHPYTDFFQTSALPLPAAYGLHLQSMSDNPTITAYILLLYDTHLPVNSCDCRLK